MISNPIQSIVRARLAALMAKSNEAESVEHMGLRGQLREKYLIEFFRDVIPQQLSVTSGIVCDASGATSRQMDFIITDNHFLPAMALNDDISIVPVEAAFMTAEIKSTLTSDGLAQVLQQVEGLRHLRFSNSSHTNSNNDVTKSLVKFPSVILAYQCNVSRKRLVKFLTDSPLTIGICVIGQFSLLKMRPQGTIFIEPDPQKGSFWESLVFIGKLYHALNEVAYSRTTQPNWDLYMQGLASLEET